MSKLQGIRRPLFRAFTKEQYAIDFVHGKFRLGELGYYRRIEDRSRQDRSEGYGDYFDSQMHQVHTELGGAIYVLSFSNPDVDSSVLRKKMGTFVVRVDDPESLASDVEQYLESRGIRTFNGVHGRPVEYTKGHIIHRNMDAHQCAVLSVIQKPKLYQYQCEYRFFTILKKDPQTEFLDIDLGRPITYVELLSGWTHTND